MPFVAHVRNAGAVILGKTTTPEFGWKGVTDSPLTGITRNPWNTERTPGGSSGGAAAAAAVGMGALHVGTDAGGSDDSEGMKYGLTLARRYVHMLGGEVSFEYRQGDVTALTIDIPFKKVESEIVMPRKDDEKIVGAA